MENGVLTLNLYKSNKTLLIYSTNGSACVPYGLVGDRGNKYPYGCAHSRLRRLFDLNRVTYADRPATVTVFFNTPPRIENKDLTFVACIVTQYGVWKETESNPIASEIMRKTAEIDHAHHLNEDTAYLRKRSSCIARQRWMNAYETMANSPM